MQGWAFANTQPDLFIWYFWSIDGAEDRGSYEDVACAYTQPDLLFGIFVWQMAQKIKEVCERPGLNDSYFLFYCSFCPIDGAEDGESYEDDACADTQPDLFIGIFD